MLAVPAPGVPGGRGHRPTPRAGGPRRTRPCRQGGSAATSASDAGGSFSAKPRPSRQCSRGTRVVLRRRRSGASPGTVRASRKGPARNGTHAPPVALTPSFAPSPGPPRASSRGRRGQVLRARARPEAQHRQHERQRDASARGSLHARDHPDATREERPVPPTCRGARSRRDEPPTRRRKTNNSRGDGAIRRISTCTCIAASATRARRLAPREIPPVLCTVRSLSDIYESTIRASTTYSHVTPSLSLLPLRAALRHPGHEPHAARVPARQRARDGRRLARACVSNASSRASEGGCAFRMDASHASANTAFARCLRSSGRHSARAWAHASSSVSLPCPRSRRRRRFRRTARETRRRSARRTTA